MAVDGRGLRRQPARHAPPGRPPPTTARAHERLCPAASSSAEVECARPGGAESDMPAPRDLILDDRRQVPMRGTTALAARAVVYGRRQHRVRKPDDVLRALEEVRVNGPVDDAARSTSSDPRTFGSESARGPPPGATPTSWRRRARGGVLRKSIVDGPLTERVGRDHATRHVDRARPSSSAWNGLPPDTRWSSRSVGLANETGRVGRGAGPGWRRGSVGRPRRVRRRRRRPGSRVGPAARRGCGGRAAAVIG